MMRVALALALLLAAPALAGCLAAEEAPEPVTPANEPSAVEGQPAQERQVRLEGVAKCELCLHGTDEAVVTVNLEAARFDVKVPRPVNATLNVTWEGEPDTMRVYGNTGNVRFEAIVERGSLIVLPLEDFVKQSRVTVLARPAETGAYMGIRVALELVLTYEVRDPPTTP